MKKVYVCAGSKLPKSLKILNQAERLGRILAQANVTYVQGGSADGLMGATLKEFCKHSTNVEVVIHAKYYD